MGRLTYQGLKVITGPAAYPLTVKQARAQLNLPDSLGNDDYLTALIAAATKAVETATGLLLITQSVRQVHDGFPSGAIVLRTGPVSTVTSITYTDEAGDSQTWSASEYDTDLVSIPARIHPKPNYFYPLTSTKIASVQVNYSAGYGATGDSVPADILHALRLLITDYYENREDSPRTLTTAVSHLLSPYLLHEHYFGQC